MNRSKKRNCTRAIEDKINKKYKVTVVWLNATKAGSKCKQCTQLVYLSI